jgi:lincosamide nucleotidyltransferase A/C/D/E
VGRGSFLKSYGAPCGSCTPRLTTANAHMHPLLIMMQNVLSSATRNQGQPPATNFGNGRICPVVAKRGGAIFRTDEILARDKGTYGSFLVENTVLTSVNSVDVVDFYRTITQLGIELWIDGGWGVDALLGEQTRAHKDLDIAIQQKDVPGLCHLLQARGYTDIKLGDARPWNFVLGDEMGREIDVHVIVLDDQGNGIYGPPENDEMYPAASLTGTGNIGGHAVRCISPEWMVKFHSGYDLKDKDFLDVSALCKKFGIELPPAYEPFKERISKPS